MITITGRFSSKFAKDSLIRKCIHMKRQRLLSDNENCVESDEPPRLAQNLGVVLLVEFHAVCSCGPFHSLSLHHSLATRNSPSSLCHSKFSSSWKQRKSRCLAFFRDIQTRLLSHPVQLPSHCTVWLSSGRHVFSWTEKTPSVRLEKAVWREFWPDSTDLAWDGGGEK